MVAMNQPGYESALQIYRISQDAGLAGATPGKPAGLAPIWPKWRWFAKSLSSIWRKYHGRNQARFSLTVTARRPLPGFTRLCRGQGTYCSPAQAGQLLICLALSIFLTVCQTSLVWAQTPSRAGLVVVHGDGDVITKCVEFSGSELSGYELLQQSGLDLNVEAGGDGASICRIDQEGCSYPQQSCFCKCQSSTCTYWSYWQTASNAWQYSSLGASNTTVHNGDVQGWVWGAGIIGKEANMQPPQKTFAEICGAEAVPSGDTASPVATDTPAPSPPTPRPGCSRRQRLVYPWLHRRLPWLRLDQPPQPPVRPSRSLRPNLLQLLRLFLSPGRRQFKVNQVG